jgi:hypothetical protein
MSSRGKPDSVATWSLRPAWLLLAVVGALAAAALSGCFLTGNGERPAPSPAEQGPARVCGNQALLRGPATPPRGAVRVPAGDNGDLALSRPGRTYWFAPGTHTLGDGEFSQIVPGDGSRYVGAPGAVLDGRKVNRYAFSGHARGVVIEHLTIENFGERGSNNNEGVVNHNSGAGWTIRYTTIQGNAGAGLMLGSGNVVEHSCLTRNEQYGFNAYSSQGPVDVTLDRNEISFNNTYDWESKIEGCGCTGGGKFWSVTGATVTGNYVHDNHGVGLWADNNNRGFLIADNEIADNDNAGIVYETSYNAEIRDNTLVRNGLVAGPDNPGFPTGAIYVSESGADPRVDTRFDTALEITGNVLEDNWSGVVLWENADRYCGSPANTSTGECTLVDPDQVTARTCNRGNIDEKPFYGDCRWKTQNVKVHDNVFRLDRTALGAKCTADNGCGVNGVFSNWGTYPSWSPYQGRAVEKAITYHQGNRFFDNRYHGNWRFMPVEQGKLVGFRTWRTEFGQDAGSTITGTASGATGG